MRVGPLHTIDEVAEGNEGMEKGVAGSDHDEAGEGRGTGSPLQPDLEGVNKAARRSGQGGFRGGRKPAMAELPDKSACCVR